MSSWGTARGKIIFATKTTRSNCFQNKMGHFLMQYTGNNKKFFENLVQGGFKITTLKLKFPRNVSNISPD